VSPYGRQMEATDLVKEKPDKRTAHGFWEPDGGVGKSELLCTCVCETSRKHPCAAIPFSVSCVLVFFVLS